MEKEMVEGFCRYCGTGKMVEVDAAGEPQEMADILATESCDCIEAKEKRRRDKQKEECIQNIDKMFGEEHVDIANIFINSIEPLQDHKFSKIIVNTYSGVTWRLAMKKDGINVERESKQKMELKS